MAYIESELFNFPDSQEFIDILELKKNENQHSLAICVYMTNKCKSKFHFARENAQQGSYTIDIGVYQGSNLFFTIKAKILPIPLTDSNRKEYEYVYGRGGGILRFKDGVHGIGNTVELLPENGMLAYIKENEFDYWLEKINQWIEDAQWDNSEKLSPIALQNPVNISKISRLSSTPIHVLKTRWSPSTTFG